jgi:hypothetical protein
LSGCSTGGNCNSCPAMLLWCVNHSPEWTRGPISDEPQWRYRVYIDNNRLDGQTFTTFLHAVTRAEDVAASLRPRNMFLEEDVPALLADYRRQA